LDNGSKFKIKLRKGLGFINLSYINGPMTVGQQYTLNQDKLRPALKLVNSFLKINSNFNSKTLEFDRNSILDKAKRKTGLNDFGNDKFIKVMDKLIQNVNNVKITPIGKFFIKLVLYRVSINRLFLNEYIQRNPAIEDIDINSPIFVIGFPRTGTTLLQNVLSAGKGYRSLYFWELITPYPLHKNYIKDKQKRMMRANLLLRLFKLGAPDLPIVHDIKVKSKEECWILLANTLVLINTDLGTGLHQWNRWIMQMDRSWVYEEYKRLLQIQAHMTKTDRFVLKCPSHIWNIDSILRVFPDACFVWAHRNPTKIIASTCSLVGIAKRFFYDSIDKSEVGESVLTRFASVADEAIKFRNNVDDNQFYDVIFNDLIKNTPESVRRIKDYFKQTHEKSHENEIQNYLKISRKGKFRMHSYSLEQFNLKQEEVIDRFQKYIERFEIPIN
jgi:hypothetical protein